MSRTAYPLSYTGRILMVHDWILLGWSDSWHHAPHHSWFLSCVPISNFPAQIKVWQEQPILKDPIGGHWLSLAEYGVNIDIMDHHHMWFSSFMPIYRSLPVSQRIRAWSLKGLMLPQLFEWGAYRTHSLEYLGTVLKCENGPPPLFAWNNFQTGNPYEIFFQLWRNI